MSAPKPKLPIALPSTKASGPQSQRAAPHRAALPPPRGATSQRSKAPSLRPTSHRGSKKKAESSTTPRSVKKAPNAKIAPIREERADPAPSGFASDVSKLFGEIFGWASRSDVAPTPVAAVEDVNTWLSSEDELKQLELAALKKLEEKAALEEEEEQREEEEARERECVRVGDRVAAIIIARGIALARAPPVGRPTPRPTRAPAPATAPADKDERPTDLTAASWTHEEATLRAAKADEHDVVELGRRCAAAFVAKGIAMVHITA